MRYFKAFEIDDNPEFVAFATIANSDEELELIGEVKNPLVLSEHSIPEYQFGRCILKIVDGELVQRTAAEMNFFEQAYILKEKILAQKNAVRDLDKFKFYFDHNWFYMDSAFRIRIAAVEKLNFTSSEFMNVEGNVVTISNLQFIAFSTAYYNEIKELTEIKT